MALTENFGANEMKQTQWTAFLHRNSTLDAPADFKEIVACVSQFLSPVFYHAEITPKKWIPGVAGKIECTAPCGNSLEVRRSLRVPSA